MVGTTALLQTSPVYIFLCSADSSAVFHILMLCFCLQTCSTSSSSNKQDCTLVPVVKTEPIPKIEHLDEPVDIDKKVSQHK